MTVKELQQLLDKVPPDAEVYLSPVIWRHPVGSVDQEDDETVVLS